MKGQSFNGIAIHIVTILLWVLIEVFGVSAAQAAHRCPDYFSGAGGATLRPGEAISSADVPVADAGALFAWVKTDDHAGYVLPVEGDSTTLRFNLLWHPEHPWLGGRARIELTDGEWTCPPVDVEIAALARADGAFNVLLALLKQGLENQAVRLGADLESLGRSDYSSDIPSLMLLSMLAQSLDGDDGADSLAAGIAAMRADTDPEAQEALALMEAMLAATGLLDKMYADLSVSMQSPEAAADTDGQAGILPLAYWTGGSRQPASARMRGEDGAWRYLPVAGGANATAPILNPPVFRNARELSEAMYGQFRSETGLLPDVQIYRDAAGSLLTINGALAASAGPLGRVVSKGYTGLGQALFLWTLFDKLRDGLFPHKLVDMRISASRDLIYTDAKPDSGVVDAIWVTPRAKGIDMSKIALDFVVQYLPVNKLAGMRSGSSVNRIAQRDSTRTAGKMFDDLKGGGEASRKIAGEMRQLDRLSEQGFQKTLERARLNDGLLEGVLDTSKWTFLGKIIEKLPRNGVVPPFNYPPVNIYQRGYVDLKLSRPGIVEVDFPRDGLMTYRAAAVGQVTFNAYTRSGKFGNTNATAEHLVRVREGQGLHIAPGNPVVAPGDSVRLFIVWGEESEVAPAQFQVDYKTDRPGHRYTLSPAPARMTVNGYPQWAYTLDVVTTADKQLFPIRVDVWLRSRPGAVVHARIDPVAIVPGEGCIEPGAEVVFRVPTSAGTAMRGLAWKLVSGPGRIDSHGVYRAPDKAGRGDKLVVQAASRKGMVLTREMRLHCGCEWRLDAHGRHWEGSDVTLMTWDVPGSQPSHTVNTHDGMDVTVSIQSPNPAMPGSRAGLLNVTAGAAFLITVCNDDENQDGVCDPEPERPQDYPKSPPHASYVLTSVAGDFVEGSISGNAIEILRLTGQERQLPTTPVSFRFRAKRANVGTGNGSLALAKSLVASAGSISGQTLTQYEQLTAILGAGGCNSDPEWEEAQKRRTARPTDGDDSWVPDYPQADDSAAFHGQDQGQGDADDAVDDPIVGESWSPAANPGDIATGQMDFSGMLPLLPDVDCVEPGQSLQIYLPVEYMPLRNLFRLDLAGPGFLSDEWLYRAPDRADARATARISLHERDSGTRLAERNLTLY